MALFPFLKTSKSKAVPEIEQIYPSYRYDLEQIHNTLERWAATKEEKISFLDLAIRVVGNDVQSQHFAQSFYEQFNGQCSLRNLIPIERVVAARRVHKWFPLENCFVFTIPCDLKKIRDTARDIDREGHHSDVNDDVGGFFIRDFNAVFLVNERCHITAIKPKNVLCCAMIKEYALEDAFSKMSTNRGNVWTFVDIELGREVKFDVIDPRIALMYDLAKERYCLQKGIDGFSP